MSGSDFASTEGLAVQLHRLKAAFAYAAGRFPKQIWIRRRREVFDPIQYHGLPRKLGIPVLVASPVGDLNYFLDKRNTSAAADLAHDEFTRLASEAIVALRLLNSGEEGIGPWLRYLFESLKDSNYIGKTGDGTPAISKVFAASAEVLGRAIAAANNERDNHVGDRPSQHSMVVPGKSAPAGAAKPRKKRGAKVQYDATADRELCNVFKASGMNYAQFAELRRLNEVDVRAAVDRDRKR